MKTPTAIPGFTFEKLPYPDLVESILAIPGWVPELLGLSTDGHEIYGFTYGDTATKPVMHVEGNVHGFHEWRTCHWVSQFMRYLHDPTGLATDTISAIEELKTRYSFSFIPSINPDGYVRNIYQNGRKVNLNRNFDFGWTLGPSEPTSPQYRGTAPFSEVETQYVRDRITRLRPISFMDTHTWGSSNEGFTSLIPREVSQRPLVAEFHNEVKKAVGMFPDGNAPHNMTEQAGLAGNWGAVTPSSLGGTPISITFESGGGWSPEMQSHVGMTAILYHMLSVDAAMHVPPVVLPPPAASTAWGPIRIDGQTCPVVSVSTSVNGALSPIWTAT